MVSLNSRKGTIVMVWKHEKEKCQKCQLLELVYIMNKIVWGGPTVNTVKVEVGEPSSNSISDSLCSLFINIFGKRMKPYFPSPLGVGKISKLTWKPLSKKDNL